MRYVSKHQEMKKPEETSKGCSVRASEGSIAGQNYFGPVKSIFFLVTL